MFASAQELIEREQAEERLEAEIAEVCGLLNATTGRLVDLIAEAIATESWRGVGIRSVQHWVAWKCGLSPARATGLVAMATRLTELPVAAAAFRAGELSEDQTRVVCRFTPTHNDAEVTETARYATVTQLLRVLRPYEPTPEPAVPGDNPEPPEQERRVSFGTDDTTWSMTVKAPLDEGALIEGALTAARQHLFNNRDGNSERDGGGVDHSSDRDRSPSGGSPAGDGEDGEREVHRDDHPSDGRRDVNDISWMDALMHLIDLAEAEADITRPRHHRYLALLHLETEPGHTPAEPDPATQAGTTARPHGGPTARPHGGFTANPTSPDDDPIGHHGGYPAFHPNIGLTGHIHGGLHLPDALRRYVTCDGHIRAVQNVDGIPISIGRTQRTVPDRLRWTIEDRDRGCRTPGCTRTRWLHIHHIVHWEHGGPTDTDNLVALCGTHHRLHHTGHLGITGNPNHTNGLTFTDGNGRHLQPHAPPTPPTAETAARLGITPGTYTHPTGEHLQEKWFSLSDPPNPN